METLVAASASEAIDLATALTAFPSSRSTVSNRASHTG